MSNNELSTIKPLPLITREIVDDEETLSLPLSPEYMSFYGYSIIIALWLIFLVTLNSIFRLWKFIIAPLSGTSAYDKVYDFFEIWDYYVLSTWSLYVVIWWWAIISWCGLKLFRHSKGISIENWNL